MKFIILILMLFSFNTIFGQSLQDYINIALKHSSFIKSSIYNEKIAKEKLNAVNNFSNTKIKFGAYILQPETRIGNQAFKIGVSQQFPWFGTSKAKKEWQLSKVQLANLNTELVNKNITFQVKKAYYDIFEKEAILRIYIENNKIFKSYIVVAQAALQNNRASMTDVLMIRLRKNDLSSKITQINNDIQTITVNFNRLLEQDINTSILVPDKINLSIKKATNYQIDEHPTMQKNTIMMAVLEKEKQFVNKSSKPKFSVGLDYTNVLERPNFVGNNNGKDILTPQISFSIPIFNSSYKSKRKQIDLQQAQILDKAETQRNVLLNALNNAQNQYNNALINIQYQQENIETTQRATRLLLKTYENNKINFDRILDLQLLQIKYQTNIIKATKKALIAQAKIAYLTNN